jgi:hypothetical protein
MATSTGNFVFDNSSLANFKSWAQAISNAFAAFGWTQTADTGQVVWGSIGAVPASTYVYEVWKANDAQAATLPIFVKVEYGFSATSPRVRVTPGTGSNGTGTITGAVSAAPWELETNTAAQGATTFPCFFSGDAGEFRMFMWSSTTVNVGLLFCIERAKDSSGNKTTSYFTVLNANANASNAAATSTFQNQQSVLSTSLIGNRDTGIIAPALTNNSGSGSFNGTVAALPVLPIIGKVGNPMLGVMAVAAADVSDGATVTVTSMYGGTHTYVAARGSGATPGYSLALGHRSLNPTAMALLMRYE